MKSSSSKFRGYWVLGGVILAIGFITGIFFSADFNLTGGIHGEEYYSEAPQVETGYKEYSKKFIDAAKKVENAVVNIYTEKTVKTRGIDPFEGFGDEFLDRFFGVPRRHNIPREREYRTSSLGSGVIVNASGYILTNSHVVKDADNIKVKLVDGRSFDAEVVGADEKSDIAVVRIKDSDRLPFARLGNSDSLEVGEWVVAVGNPFGLTHTVTAGIVSALGRANVNVIPDGYEYFIQTDVAINPGNSGGPLINLAGDVVGINTAIFSKTGGYMGIGFSIPINMAKKVMVDLIEKGYVERGYLGVFIQNLNPDLAEKMGISGNQKGILVAEVIKDGPAEKAGLQQGDIILEFDGKKVETVTQLRNAVASTNVGKQVEVDIIRKGKEKKMEVMIEKQPEDMGKLSRGPSAAGSSEDWGFSVRNITDELAREYGIEADNGVIVTEVDPDGVAARSGIQVGDLLLMIDNENVPDVKTFNQLMDQFEAEKSLLVLIKRSGHNLYLVLKR